MPTSVHKIPNIQNLHRAHHYSIERKLSTSVALCSLCASSKSSFRSLSQEFTSNFVFSFSSYCVVQFHFGCTIVVHSNVLSTLILSTCTTMMSESLYKALNYQLTIYFLALNKQSLLRKFSFLITSVLSTFKFKVVFLGGGR